MKKFNKHNQYITSILLVSKKKHVIILVFLKNSFFSKNKNFLTYLNYINKLNTDSLKNFQF